ncbi:F-box/LRR-repeat protein 17 isoform 2-T2 [Mantella aurantiaca]
MGGLFCKQRSRSRPPHSAPSRRKKPHRVDCLLRGPCLLCFIVHGEHPTSEAASPDLPAAQDCARLLLLCPGELSAWQERHLCGGLLRGPGLRCPATEDMVCKRKNCEDNQQPLTPCKQPRCAPAREQTHLHGEDLLPNQEDPSPHSHGEDLPPQQEDLLPNQEDPSPHSHGEDLLPHQEDPSPHSHGEDLPPQQEDLLPHQEDPSPHSHGEDLQHHQEDLLPHQVDPSTHSHGEDLLPHQEDPSPHSHGEDLPPHQEDLLPHQEDPSPHSHGEDLPPHQEDPSPHSHGEDLLPHQEDPSPHSHGEDLQPHQEDLSPPTHVEDLPPQPRGEDVSPHHENLSRCPGGTSLPQTKDLSCSAGESGDLFVENSLLRDMSHNSSRQPQSLSSGLTDPYHSQELNCPGKWYVAGGPAPTSPGMCAHSLPGRSQHPKEHLALSGDLITLFAADQEPHCSGVNTLQCQGDHITRDYVHCFTGDQAILCTELPDKPENMESLHLCPEDHGQHSENSCCSTKLSSCPTMCQDHKPSSLAAPSQVEWSSSGCNQTAPSQSPKLEGEVLVPCEPLYINHLPPSLLLKIFSLLSLNERCLSASLVCKYWRDLCLDFQFWKQLDLSSRQQVNDNLLEKIASRCWNITEINISDCLNVTDDGICKLAMNCSGLVKYTAYRCKQLSDPSLISLATHCPSMQKLHVGNQDRLTDKALNQLGSRCKDLRDIHFGQCYKISDEGMVVIAKGCPKLQKIYMQENKLVTNRSMEAFAEHCPELQYVGFMGCSVTSHGVIHLTSLKNLSSLDLRNITELDNQTVVEIVKKCQSLTSLNLCLNRNIDDRCVEVIAKEGRSLKELYLVTCKITDHE